MNGIKLAQAVRGRWPPIKIIATSGHYKVGDGDLPTGGRFIRNPTLPGTSSKLSMSSRSSSGARTEASVKAQEKLVLRFLAQKRPGNFRMLADALNRNAACSKAINSKLTRIPNRT